MNRSQNKGHPLNISIIGPKSPLSYSIASTFLTYEEGQPLSFMAGLKCSLFRGSALMCAAKINDAAR